MSDKTAREHALEEKKKKLEELRQMRAQRMQQASIDETGSARMAALAGLSNQGSANNNNAPGHKSTQSAEDILNSVSSLIAAPAAAPKTAAASSLPTIPQGQGQGSARSSPKLVASAPTHIDIVAVGDNKIVYEQSTQTELKRKQAEAEAAAAVAGSPTATATAGTSMAAVWDSIDSDERDEIIHERDDLRTREVTLLSRIRELTRASQTRAAAEEAAAEKALHAELDPAEAEKILESEEFGSFLDRSSKIMERLLGFEAARGAARGATGAGLLASSLDGFDYMADYSAADENEFDGKNGRGVGEQMLTPSIVFANEGAAATGTSTGHSGSERGGAGLSFARTTNRPVTSINWSPKFPELLLASYASAQTSMDAAESGAGMERENWMEPDGSVLVWNLHMSKRPEFMFSCQSSIHTALFHPAHPKLIVGGCENGQLVIWDMRIANRHTPVNRSSLSSGHTHPIFALDIQPLASGLFQIVSASSDGQVCLWTENNLHRPLHDIQLVNMRGGGAGSASASASSADGGVGVSGGGGINLGSKDELTTTCFDLPGRDTNTLILGSDEGRIYKARLHDATAPGSGGANAAANAAAAGGGGVGLSSGASGDRIYEQIQAHEAPMTSLQFHPTFKGTAGSSSAGGGPANDLFLTSSFDWTVKLWSNKLSRPLYTFESSRDYVHAAAWCPTNPYVFASGDGTGHLDIWSLAGKGEGDDAGEVPTVSVQVGAQSQGGASGGSAEGGLIAPVGPGVSASPAPGADASDASASASLLRPNHAAISAIKWNDTGSLIAAGLSSGSLHIYSVSSDLHTPTRESTDRFYNNIANRMAHPR